MYVEKILENYGYSKETIDELITNYSESFRAYHNIDHIHNLLIKFLNGQNINVDEINNYSFDERVAIYKQVEIAICFHDVKYIVGSKDNEYNSAEYFKEVTSKNPKVQLTPIEIENINVAILSTFDHIPVEDNLISKILIQLDLSGFDGHFCDVLEVEDKVYAEFISFTDATTYYAKKIDFLKLYQSRVDQTNITMINNIKYLTEVIKHRLFKAIKNKAMDSKNKI